MSNVQELKDRVVEAARTIVRRYKCGLAADRRCKPDKQMLIKSVDALADAEREADAQLRPDMDALDRDVAEMAEKWLECLEAGSYNASLWSPELRMLVGAIRACRAAREAEKPRPRYGVAWNPCHPLLSWTVVDSATTKGVVCWGDYNECARIADLLNAAEGGK